MLQKCFKISENKIPNKVLNISEYILFVHANVIFLYCFVFSFSSNFDGFLVYKISLQIKEKSTCFQKYQIGLENIHSSYIISFVLIIFSLK